MRRQISITGFACEITATLEIFGQLNWKLDRRGMTALINHLLVDVLDKIQDLDEVITDAIEQEEIFPTEPDILVVTDPRTFEETEVVFTVHVSTVSLARRDEVIAFMTGQAWALIDHAISDVIAVSDAMAETVVYGHGGQTSETAQWN